MELLDVLKNRRSIRRFKQEPVSDALLEKLISAAASAPSAGNQLPLRYVVARTPEQVKALFDLTAWGAKVKPKRNPSWGVSAPAAFIAVCTANGNASPFLQVDAGAAIQSLLLQAVDLGLGACWLGAFNKEQAAALLGLEGLSCLYLIGVGKPDETPVAASIKPGDSTNYYLDENDVLHVPKYDPATITVWK